MNSEQRMKRIIEKNSLKRLAAIIPAYNEENTIQAIIKSLKETGIFEKIIVVNDGSSDATSSKADEARATVIEHTVNKGKAAAMKTGFQNTSADIILFLDADLIGLNGIHISSLVDPIIKNDADMTVGVFDEGRFTTDLAQIISPNLSGQRAVKREILEGMFKDNPEAEISRFGIEVLITRYTTDEKYRVKTVILEELSHRTKEEKLGLIRGFAARIKMYYEIIKSTPTK